MATAVFGRRLPLAERYVELLATAGVERGLVGPREVPRLWDRHLLNCAGVALTTRQGETVVDLGSGAGLPGIVVALARPDLRVEVVDSMARRTRFLEEVVAHLRLDTVQVRRARAEELEPGRADVVTARALAPLERLIGWAAPLLSGSGRLVLLKGGQVADEVTAAWRAIVQARCADVRLFSVVPALATAAGLGDGIRLVAEGCFVHPSGSFQPATREPAELDRSIPEAAPTVASGGPADAPLARLLVLAGVHSTSPPGVEPVV